MDPFLHFCVSLSALGRRTVATFVLWELSNWIWEVLLQGRQGRAKQRPQRTWQRRWPSSVWSLIVQMDWTIRSATRSFMNRDRFFVIARLHLK